ncbi:MAG: nitroreductase family protein [Rhodothermia bacterium]|nr:MAG: nitroreductase family protein [Rhodothermia bacterium]
MPEPVFELFTNPFHYDSQEMLDRARAIRDELRLRRTIRDYDAKEVSRDVIEACIEAASTAPSGANKQPWHFVVVTDPSVKHEIRVAAEKEELAFYTERAPQEWLDALAHIGTDQHKPFLETAPVLIAVFAQNYEVGKDGAKLKNYYVQESVGIATGMLIAALHHAGLSMLTHTPSPMGFLSDILERPKHERAYLLLVVGHAAEGARVPKLTKKNASEIISYV